MRALQHVFVDEKVVAEESELVGHVGKEAADQGSQVDHVRRLVFVKHCLGLLKGSVKK